MGLAKAHSRESSSQSKATIPDAFFFAFLPLDFSPTTINLKMQTSFKSQANQNPFSIISPRQFPRKFLIEKLFLPPHHTITR
jgi:hypothetical protein